jgi:two-component sensor histidine kinase
LPIAIYVDLYQGESEVVDGSELFIVESNHRIANNLTLLAGLFRLHATEILSCAEASQLLQELGARVQTVAHLHGRLATTDSELALELGSYLREISSDLVASLAPPGRFRLTFKCTHDCTVPAGQGLWIGLIAAEIVTNSIKFAHPTGVRGEIVVGCVRRADRVHVEIADDGVGLPEGFDAAREGRLGLRLIRSLAERLEAELIFDCDGLGLRFELAVPSMSRALRTGVGLSRFDPMPSQGRTSS